MSEELNRRLKLAEVATTQFSGGAEAYIARLGQELDDRWGVALLGRLSTWPKGLAACDIGSGKKWALRTLVPGLLVIRRELRKLRRASELSDFSVFHLHFKREQIGFTRELSRHAPVVWTEHGRFPGGIFGRLIRPLYRRASRRAAVIVCVSNVVKMDLEQRVRPHCSLVVIDSGVDLSHWTPVSAFVRQRLRTDYQVPPDAKVCAVVGRLDVGKRPDLAILSARAAGAVVLVAGAGSLDEALRERFESDDRVIFLGSVVDARDVYAAADVHVFASSGAGEGFPTVLLEAAAVGIITIATSDCGFAADVLEAGGAVAAPSVSELGEKIEQAMASVSHPSATSIEWVAGRSIERMAAEYDRLFVGVSAKFEK